MGIFDFFIGGITGALAAGAWLFGLSVGLAALLFIGFIAAALGDAVIRRWRM